MQLYAGTSVDFITDATRNAIGGKLERAFADTYHYKPSWQEVQSWQSSLLQMSAALIAGKLLDHGILLEFQLPLTSSRLDCMVTGHSFSGLASSVIVELKQWSKVEPSNAEGCVVSWVGGRLRDVHHPSRQAGQYAQYLKDMLPVFASASVNLSSCAYLHNLKYDPEDEIFSARHAALLTSSPTFAGDQQSNLIEFLNKHVGQGEGAPVLDAVVQSRFAPSKKLLEHTSRVVQDQQVYVLLDSQDVVFNKVLAEVQAASETRKIKKTVVLVHGGPGTGKSVVALHLLGRLSQSGKNVMHLTGSAAFTENMRKVVGSRAAAQFSYFNMNSKGQLPPNQFDALILDEAHRIREHSKNQWTKVSEWSGPTGRWSEVVAAGQIIEGPGAWKTAARALSSGSIVPVFYQAYPNTLFGFTVWSMLVRQYPSAMIAPIALLIPVSGMAGGAIFLGESMTWWKWLAAVLVLCGLALNQWHGGRATRAIEEDGPGA